MLNFSATVDGIPVLDRAFNRIEERISDFRFVWGSFAQDFYAIEREQFNSQGAHGLSGRWAKLSPGYAKWKARKYPNMPILQATTALYQSMTSPDANDSVFRPEADQLTIGSRTEYGRAHQRGTGSMPARPVISLTEADKKRLVKAIQLPLVGFLRRQGFTVLEQAA